MSTTSHTTIPFLQLVADRLCERFGANFSRLTVVFPNKRASLFLQDYLIRSSETFLPRYITISELFTEFSPLSLNNEIDTVCRIYNIYHRLTGSDESLDSFYGWGEKLLSDFDDIDKNMAEAERLLQNTTDFRSIDFGDYLTSQQQEAVSQFFHKQDGSARSRIRSNFFKLWNHLLPIYSSLRQELREEGLAYEGMLYRDVVEKMKDKSILLPAETEVYAFVGFNVLDRVEEQLFQYLKEQGKALFFWDYDDFYVAPQPQELHYEAGEFIGRNLRLFPNEIAPEHFQNMLRPKTIDFVAASSENIQAYHTADWLADHLTSDARRTAVVLCNENLLEAVLHALPVGVKDVNITKGFPLAHTPAYRDIVHFLDETEKNDKKYSNADLLNDLSQFILDHAQNTSVSMRDDLEEVASESQSYNQMLQQLYAEAYFQSYTLVGTFRALVESGRLQVGRVTLGKLLRQLLRQKNVPFHGEPSKGLEVMGLLETRNLDFQNVLLLSANEGMLPRPSSDSSFIPYPIKSAYGLTLASKKTSVYAYYLFRLIQRAQHVRFLYNATADGLRTGEMSRFMTQLLVSKKFNIHHFALAAKSGNRPWQPLSAPKPANLYDLLNPIDMQRNDGTRIPLSPSSLNAYLDCPLKFYYSRIARLKKMDASADVIENNTFGTIFHDAAEFYYRPYIGRKDVNFKVENGRVLAEKGDITLRRCIDEAYKNSRKKPDVVVTESVLAYLRQLLRCDAELDDLYLAGLETEEITEVNVHVGGEEKPFLIGGRLDRLDVATNPKEDGSPSRTLRIVDYKTGRNEQSAKAMHELFGWDYGEDGHSIVKHEKPKRAYYLFQVFLYALTQYGRTRQICGEELPVSAVLFYPALAVKKDFDPWIMYGGARLHAITPEQIMDFHQRLERTLEDLFDLSTPFRATSNPDTCIHCDFARLCGRAEHF